MKFWIVCLLLSVCSAEEGYIGVKTCGGQLGNQLFDVAATVAYAWDHELTPVFPDFKSQENNLAYNYSQVFFRLDREKESPFPLPLHTVENPGFVQLSQDLKNVLLDGGLFSWKYFDHHREAIQKLFEPKEELVEKLAAKYGELIGAENTVAVHVRSYSKAVHETGLHFVGFAYFKEAMDQFSKDSLFVVFSDRIQWAKANFQKRFPDKQFVFIEGNDYIEDFYLMSMMKHQIVSRSSFSWWSAYLNKNLEKQIYVPILKEEGIRGFLKPYAKQLLTFFGKVFWWDENYWLPEWSKLFYSLEPYPEDLYSYGDESTSLYSLDK